MAAAHLPRTLLCVLAAVTAALWGAGRAEAGYGVSPIDQTLPTTVDSIGYVLTPATIDFVVHLDEGDTSPFVWVSETLEIGPNGSHQPRQGVGSCATSGLFASGEPGKWVCRVSTQTMRRGRSYYWWLTYWRQEAAGPVQQVSGPFVFGLGDEPPPPPPPPGEPEPEPEPPKDPHAGASTKKAESAARLPTARRFDGRRSVKHASLTQLVYRTMKALGAPRQLAFACWNVPDWISVLSWEGAEPTRGSTQVMGFWLGRQPRWLHLAPEICTDVQGLLSSKRPNARRAGALAVAIHETLHAYGLRNEAQTNCFAVQLVPVFGWALGLTPTRYTYMGRLAHNYVRRSAPSGYWNARHCREGGAWDIFEGPNVH